MKLLKFEPSLFGAGLILLVVFPNKMGESSADPISHPIPDKWRTFSLFGRWVSPLPKKVHHKTDSRKEPRPWTIEGAKDIHLMTCHQDCRFVASSSSAMSGRQGLAADGHRLVEIHCAED